MSKTDVDALPVRLPKKRRAVERLPDVWLARWADGEGDLSREDRERAVAERLRRKEASRVVERHVGLVVPEEGVTPEQADAVVSAVRGSGATTLHHGGVPRKLHVRLREVVPIEHHKDGWRYGEKNNQAVVRGSDAVIAAVKETTTLPYASGGVWGVIGYARNRGVPVTVIKPNGGTED
jgi:hypothetical protein